ncbi:MAG: tyrosine--tRNA ligase [Nitrospinaceae bacterium]|nr:tyrosine--tRNA ligase [Nitrospina sp.]MBT5377051.1 tyrosine--tRNA ligase [Nitrospinaceae bacterium]MBT5867816.1 tyrosine--tRNA ligase [Nitrospinaceae bacterium]MBT6345790.1 tyrosine--tRNA ligase [Nitrospina sp.]
MLPVQEQLKTIRRGVSEIIDEKELADLLASGKPLRVKAGFDPTAPDLHLGHTVLLHKMRQFQKLGHEVIFLIGDFTGMIGDPTGRSETRKNLTPQEVQENAKTYLQQVYKILDKDKTTIAYNSEWMNKFTSVNMIELAAHYTVARMLERDDFQKRLAKNLPVSIHELMYPLIQGYDSVALKSDLELGGTDQKFNLLVGRDLQRAYGQKPQLVLTMPLLEGTDGVQKMSKSLGNSIGVLDAPNDMFGKIMSISDDLMWRYYELLSQVSAEELENLKKQAASGELNPKHAKMNLAKEIVACYNSPEAAEMALAEFENVFKKKNLPEDIPVVQGWGETSQGICNILKDNKMTDSTSAARRLIQQGSVTVNGEKISDINQELIGNQEYLIKVGKKRFLKIQPG